MIAAHGKHFASLAELRRYRFNVNGKRYMYNRDGQKGTVRWDDASKQGTFQGQSSFFGIFTADNGAQFTVADHEVTLLQNSEQLF